MLKSASEVRNEINAEKKAREDAAFKRCMENVVNAIEQHKRTGHVTLQSLPAEITQILVDNGYDVKYHPACGMGDVDSHTISW